MCFLFHKFGKWFDVGSALSEHYHIPTGKTVLDEKWTIQERHCTRCNKKQLRRVKI